MSHTQRNAYQNDPDIHIVTGVCPHDCPDTCSWQVAVSRTSGRASDIWGHPDHPVTAGRLCTKVDRYLERTYHRDRLTTPLKRIGSQGQRRVHAGHMGRGVRRHRRQPAARHRRTRPGSRTTLLLRRHDGPTAGRGHGRAILQPHGRQPPGAHDLLDSRHRGLLLHGRRARWGWTPKTSHMRRLS